MKVIVMGCGRVGARVAAVLDNNGHDVTVIDTVSRSFRRLPTDFGGQTIIGTGIDEDILRQADIDNVNAFIAVTDGDNRNIMASQVAQKIFDVPEVVCRIYDPVRESTYRKLGLSTVCPTSIISAQILDHVMAADDTPRYQSTEEF